MAKSEKDGEEEGERKRDMIGDFLKTNFEKGELALKHAVGLGEQPNVVPVTKPKLKGPPRVVEVGWHPVGGIAGKWFAEDTGLGKMITEKVKRFPDPTQHWAILVGEYAHQLWMDEQFDVIYTNEKIKREDWQTFKVGETRFNDDAVRRAGETVIADIRARQPAYNLITNNCQTFALHLLYAIKVGGHKDFATTAAVYERLLGPGKVMDLFDDDGLEGRHEVGYAQQVMDQNTTQLDPREEQAKRAKKKQKKWKWQSDDREGGAEEGKEKGKKKWKWESDDKEDVVDKKGGKRDKEGVQRHDERAGKAKSTEHDKSGDEKEKQDVKDKVLSFFGRGREQDG